jgi:AraC-like DNA-binding protein
MLLALTILGIILSVILLYFNAKKNKSVIYLGVFFFLISLQGFIQWVLLYSKSVFLVSVVYINFAFPLYLIGPAIYLYLRSVLKDNPKLYKWDLLHLLPTLIFLIYALPHMLTPWTYKLQIASRIIADPLFIETYKAIKLYEIIPISMVFQSRPLFVIFYAIWSTVLFNHHLRQKEKNRILSRQHFMTKWLFALLGFLFVLLISYTMILTKTFENQNVEMFYTLNFLMIVAEIGLFGLLISPFFFPEILYGMPRVPESVFTIQPKKNDVYKVPAEVRKSENHFELDYLISLGQKSDFYMKEFQPYLHPGCNLAYLAKLIDIPNHHLAYYFREIKKQPFNDYRNRWRVNHAKSLIREGKNNKLTLEAIGLLSGFSSRNTFFSDFKKVEGISPGSFASHFTN